MGNICSKELSSFLTYARKLSFTQKPDYGFLRGLLNDALTENGLVNDKQFEWITTGLSKEIPKVVRPRTEADYIGPTATAEQNNNVRITPIQFEQRQTKKLQQKHVNLANLASMTQNHPKELQKSEPTIPISSETKETSSTRIGSEIVRPLALSVVKKKPQIFWPQISTTATNQKIFSPSAALYENNSILSQITTMPAATSTQIPMQAFANAIPMNILSQSSPNIVIQQQVTNGGIPPALNSFIVPGSMPVISLVPNPNVVVVH